MMQMKIVAVNGSHTGKGGNTAAMVAAFLKGAEAAGAETAHILLADKKIEYCRACKACWFASPGKCVMDDDMAALLPLLKDADVWVWATPLYFDNIASRLKTFIDRLMVLVNPGWTKDAAGECRHLTTGPMPKLVMIANCGYPERSHFQVISHWIERHARNLGTEVIGEIYAPEGALLKTAADELRPVISRYLKALETAGAEIAGGLSLSAQTRQSLAQPFVSPEDYFHGVQEYLAAMRSKAGRA
jgi:Multimeric flavodoxin WrbA